jgi:hypothetical protein
MRTFLTRSFLIHSFDLIGYLFSLKDGFFMTYSVPGQAERLSLLTTGFIGTICKLTVVGVVDTGDKFATGVVDTGDKFATGVGDTGDKFATGVVDTGDKFAMGVVDTGDKFATGVVDTGDKFATGVVDTGHRCKKKTAYVQAFPVNLGKRCDHQCCFHQQRIYR